ncbi:hypothetical protein MYSTI_02441 [Myxococcus stipitatus DSM 14675]|uniref:DUF7481 domain-containing protein n=1 Tax=Myxococcus stipitatus (strain DSM 14675 / JCM 12634 / Mx s8) TaxID=1278073 RepID=L7U844_MYXSD|nr:hypothetical protein [Myxococcus stipitatus]AGC43757.1 hypothetical protein MYSTI_02441 [Myxococcus stipitatus DSM 14675]
MRCRFSGWVLALLFVMGCSSSSDEDNETGSVDPKEFYRGGSRLQAHVTTTAEGLSWPTESRDTWHDSTLKKGCVWEASGPDGAFTCMPQDLELVPNREQGFYFDAACTEGMYAARSPLPSGPLFVKKKDACGGFSSIHVVGEHVPTPSAYFHDGTKCVATQLSPGLVAFRVGEEVPAGTYVRGTLKQRQTGPRISAYFIEGEDGSMQFSHLQDMLQDTACTPVKASDGKSRCVPMGNTTVRSLASYLAANDTCTEPAFSDVCVKTPRFAVVPAEESCGPSATVYEVGEPVTQLYISGGEGNCRPSPNGPLSGSVFGPGVEIPASTFLEAKEARLESYGRLEVRGLQLDGSVLIPSVLHDTQLGTDCKFGEDMSQKLRCFPDSDLSSLRAFFADSACTHPLTLVFEPTSRCVLSSPSRYVLERTFAVDGTPRYRAFHPGPKYEGPLFTGNNLGGNNPPSCRPLERPSGLIAYKVGAEISATSLVEGTRVRD